MGWGLIIANVTKILFCLEGGENWTEGISGGISRELVEGFRDLWLLFGKREKSREWVRLVRDFKSFEELISPLPI